MQIAVCDDEKEIRDLFTQRLGSFIRAQACYCTSRGRAAVVGWRAGYPAAWYSDAREERHGNGKGAAQKKQTGDHYFCDGSGRFCIWGIWCRGIPLSGKAFDDRKFAEVLHNATEQIKNRKKPEMPSLLINTGGKHITVNLEDLVYAEVFDRKLILHTMDAEIEYYGKNERTGRKSREWVFPHPQVISCKFWFYPKIWRNDRLFGKGTGAYGKAEIPEVCRTVSKI